MKRSILFPLLLILLSSALHASAQNTTDAAKCDCIAKYSYNAHIQEYYTSGFTCYRAWKKDMKRKKKECQAKAMESERPLAAKRKRRSANWKKYKSDTIEEAHNDEGHTHDYWY